MGKHKGAGGDYIPPPTKSRWANWWCPLCGRPRWLSPSHLKIYLENKSLCRSCTVTYKRSE